MANKWRPESWRGMPIKQVPEYPDQKALATFPAPGPSIFRARAVGATPFPAENGADAKPARKKLR